MIETSDFKIVIDNIINEIQQTQLKMFQDANTNDEPSNRIIGKEEITKYFNSVCTEYHIEEKEDILNYTREMIDMIINSNSN